MKPAAALLAIVSVVSLAAAQQTPPKPQAEPPAPTGYKDTPMQPNGKWHIHDDDRPRPVVVTPGPFVGLPAPADAIVLLGSGTDLSKWQMQDGGGPVTWPIADGVLSSGKGFIRTKEDDFTDYQLHVEFATPSEVKGQPGPRQQRRLPERRVRDPGARQLQQQVVCGRPGLGDVRPDSADGERVASAGRVAVVRHRLPGTEVHRDDARGGGDRDRAAQRRRGARRGPVLRSDGAQAESAVRALEREGPDRAAGPRQPGSLPQYLDPSDQRRRVACATGAANAFPRRPAGSPRPAGGRRTPASERRPPPR